MSLKEDMKLDITKLDEAALEQPSIFAEWGDRWAQAVLERDRLKEEIATVKAEADEEIRKNPRKFGWEAEKSPTETWVASQVILHSAVKAATEKFVEAQYEVNMATVGKEACDHRKKALEILTQLYSSNYFVAKSRSGTDYVEKLTESGRAAQEKALDENPRMRRRRS